MTSAVLTNQSIFDGDDTRSAKAESHVIVTLLTFEQIWHAFLIFRIIGAEATPTDFAVWQGAQTFFRYNGTQFEYTAPYSTASNWRSCNDGKVIVAEKDIIIPKTPNVCGHNVRPVLSINRNSDLGKYIETNSHFITINSKQVQVCSFGEYPQDYVDENSINEKDLTPSGKSYTFGFGDGNYVIKSFQLNKEKVQYVYTLARKSEAFREGKGQLPNGKKFEIGDVGYFKVQPIEWFLEKVGEDGMELIATKVLVGGIKYDCKPEYWGRFKGTDMDTWLKKYFIEEMMSNVR